MDKIDERRRGLNEEGIITLKGNKISEFIRLITNLTLNVTCQLYVTKLHKSRTKLKKV